VPVNLKFPNIDMPVKLTYPDNIYFAPQLGNTVHVIDSARNLLGDYVVAELSNGGYTLRKVSDCKVDEKEILEILQEN